MNNFKKQILKKLGYTEEVNRVEAGRCPFCNEPVIPENLRDELSRKEFEISGLCQKCQDEMFGD